MNYFNTIESFIDWVQIQKRFSKKTTLNNITHFCSLLGDPQNTFKSIHITGTNGKGSTVSMISNVLQCAGYNVGTFTSPYITCFNERISFNSKPISDNDLLVVANKVLSIYPILEEEKFEKPTFFEFITLCAFLHFSNLKNLDVVVLEVGMGGRLDSTNIVTPLVSVLTNIALDHMHILGGTKQLILTEKLGIVKNGIPLICGLKEHELIDIAKRKTDESNSKLIIPHYDSLCNINCDSNNSSFNYLNNDYQLSLIGFHQVENALIAIETLKVLQESFDITMEHIYKGLKTTIWVGRFEKVSDEPLIFIDGGHNIDGINKITSFVKSLSYNKKRCIVSISHDKELSSMINLIDETFDEIIFTEYTYSRSANSIDLYNLSNNSNKKIIKNLDDAIKYVYENNCEFNIFMGSLYLVSEVRNKILNKKCLE